MYVRMHRDLNEARLNIHKTWRNLADIYVETSFFFYCWRYSIRYENRNNFTVLKLLEIVKNLWSHVRLDFRNTVSLLRAYRYSWILKI